MATLKLYNPILSEATKECYWFCDEAGTSFKDVDEFINGIPAGDDNIELLSVSYTHLTLPTKA